MIQIAASVMSLALGLFVAIFAQERRVRLWFLLLGLSCACLTLGHHVETTSERYTFIAARVVMCSAVVAAVAGTMSAKILCGMKLHRPIWIVVAVAAAINIVTVIATDWYFDGGITRYPWGHFVTGRIEFVANPLSVSMIATYALVLMFFHYRKAHPLDKNRIGFLIVAYLFLSLTLFDYLPHFGIDVFGGLVSGVAIPLFLAAFGYAGLRFRLIEFRVFLGRAGGYVMAGILVVAGYLAFMEVARRTGMGPDRSAAGAAILVLAIFALTGRLLPQIMERAVRRGEPDYHLALETFSGDMMNELDEERIKRKTSDICIIEFRCSSAGLLDENEIKGRDQLQSLVAEKSVLEVEVARRQHAIDADILPGIELVVPLFQEGRLLAVLALGRRADGKLYTRPALQGFHTMGNIVSMALAGTRAANELQKRHSLDRYLAPQVVESVLAGGADLIERKQRVTVTVFFSDLKDFTGMSDRMQPEDLAAVLNEYLSEMAEIAFRFGGTVDKFIGDAVMVFFGAPFGIDPAHQARQCVRMAMAMQQRLAVLNGKWLSGGLLYRGLTCRIGVHTGEAIVGAFGSSSRVDYTAIGSTVNLASRLEGKCAPGMILVSRDARAHLGEEFTVVDRGSVEVKGFSEPVEVFEVDPEVTPGNS